MDSIHPFADAPIPAKDRIAGWAKAAKCGKHYQQIILDMFINSDDSNAAKKARDHVKKMNPKAACTCGD